MRPADLAPDNAEFATVDFLLGLVDVSDALAQVEIGVTPLVDILNLDERLVLVLVDLAPAYLEGTGRRQRRARVGTFIKRRTARRRSRLKKKRMARRQERTSCSRGCGLCSRGCTALPSSSL